MVMPKLFMGLDFTPTYESRDTAHVQPPNSHDY